MNSILSRRRWLGASLACIATAKSNATTPAPSKLDDEQLRAISDRPVLSMQRLVEFGLTRPVKIRSLELLKNGSTYLTRVRTQGGDEGIAVANSDKMSVLYRVFLERVAPFFVGKDARDIEGLLTQLYRRRSNYKFQGIGLWVAQAAAEMAILDLLGRLTSRSLGELLGGVKRKKIAVYRASSNRGNRVQQELEHLHRLAEETGGRALKFRLGGRMSNNADSRPGRSEALIAKVRESFGPDFTLYADANSSYDVPNAIRIGKLMEEHDYAFFEEPCPFDHLWETRQVSRALSIPIAGGEQEFSLRRFRWSIANGVVDVAQPDMHYFGGYLRTIRVARMANAAGMPCTVHMSGGGLGYIDACHLASCIDDPGPFQEFKGTSNVPVECGSSTLRPQRGEVTVPTGPGYGIAIDPDYIRKSELMSR